MHSSSCYISLFYFFLFLEFPRNIFSCFFNCLRCQVQVSNSCAPLCVNKAKVNKKKKKIEKSNALFIFNIDRQTQRYKSYAMFHVHTHTYTQQEAQPLLGDGQHSLPTHNCAPILIPIKSQSTSKDIGAVACAACHILFDFYFYLRQPTYGGQGDAISTDSDNTLLSLSLRVHLCVLTFDTRDA